MKTLSTLYVISIFLLPYGVIGFSGALFFSILLSTFVIMFYRGFILTKNELHLIYPWFFCFIMLFFINSISVLKGVSFNFTELADAFIYLNYMLMVIAITVIVKINKSNSYFINIIGFLSLPIFFSSFIAWLGYIPALNFTALFSTGEIYSKGYAEYRAFGIIGQPGKLGFFCAISSVIFLDLFVKDTRKILYLMASCLYFLSMFSSFSRISMVCWIILVIYVILSSLKMYKKIGLGFIMLFSGFYFFNQNQDLIDFLLRGVDFENLKFATLGHRFVSKIWAFQFISSDIIQLLFGVGSPKEYLGTFTNPYAIDLSLRHPDSSQTLFLIRYGLIGSFIIYSFLFLTLYKVRKNKVVSKIVLIYIAFSLLDPTFHDIKIMFLFYCVIIPQLNMDKYK